LLTAVTTTPRFEMVRRIRWADTDASGFVHFACYLKLMEETEYGFLRSRGLSVVLYDDRGTMGFPRLSAEIDVERPLVFDEQVKVELELTSIDGKQIDYHFKIHDDRQRPVATGRFKVACCRFPDDAPPYAILTPESVRRALQSGTT